MKLQRILKSSFSRQLVIAVFTIITSSTCFADPVKFLSAFFGLDGTMVNSQVCPTAENQDGMPLTFSWLLDPNSIDASDFQIIRSDGSITNPICATLMPANESNETQTILVIGDVGNVKTGQTPLFVNVSGSLNGKEPGSTELKKLPKLPLKGVTPFDSGAYIVDAWVLTPDLLLNDANKCTIGSTFIRVVWSGGITAYPSGQEVGTDVTNSYKVSYFVEGSSPVSETPLALGDLNDGDNMHDLCMPEMPLNAKLLSISLGGRLVQDPNGDPNLSQRFQVEGVYNLMLVTRSKSVLSEIVESVGEFPSEKYCKAEGASLLKNKKIINNQKIATQFICVGRQQDNL